MDENKPHVVVLGGGFAGLSAAKELAKANVSITLVDRQNHHLFQPLLYQVASGGLSATEIAQPLRYILSSQTNVRVIMDEVAGIDRGNRCVSLRKTGSLQYDYLVVGLGLKTSYFGNDAWEAHAPGLKSLDEATEIRRRILMAFEQAELTQGSEDSNTEIEFVVVGGGPTGVELSGSIAELSRKVLRDEFRRFNATTAKIRLIEAAPRLLPVFDEKHSEYTLRELEKMGVQVHLNAPVTEITDNSVTFGDTQIKTNLIFWAAGLQAGKAPRTLEGVTRDRAGRILVEKDLTIPNDDRVYIVGDLVSLVDCKEQRVPGVAPAAMQTGKHAAQQIRNSIQGKPRKAFKYFDKGNMATIGRTRAIAEFKGIKVSGFFAWIMWLVVHLLFLVGMRNRISVVHNWFWAYFTWCMGARIITQKPYSGTLVK